MAMAIHQNGKIQIGEWPNSKIGHSLRICQFVGPDRMLWLNQNGMIFSKKKQTNLIIFLKISSKILFVILALRLANQKLEGFLF